MKFKTPLKRMRFKSIKLLSLVFIGLLVVAGVYIAIQRKPKTIILFAHKELNKIEVKAKDTLCIFEKRAGGWKIVSLATKGSKVGVGGEGVPAVEYPVDTVTFNSLLEALKNLEVGEIVSSRAEKHADFEVGEDGVKIKVFWDNRSRELIVGKMAGDFMHGYIRFPPKPETYLSIGLSKYMVYRNSDDWRDHTIFSFDTSKVTELHLGEQKIARTDTGWIKGDTPIETNKINPILNLLATLRADGFSPTDFDPEFKAKIVFEDATEKILHIGVKNDKYPVKVEGNPTIFLLYPWKVDRLKNF